MFAVTVEPLNAIFFTSSRPHGDRMAVEEGVELDIPPHLNFRSDGEEPPQEILCRSVDNPRYYKLFKHTRDIDRSRFEPTGAEFGGVFSGESWGRFLRQLAVDLPTLSIEDDEPSDEARSLPGVD